MSHTMKLWERVIEWTLRKETQIIKSQFGFILGGRPWKRSIYYDMSWSSCWLLILTPILKVRK